MPYNPYPPYPYQQPLDNLGQLRMWQQQQAQSGINWVQGIDAAKAYIVAAGNSVLLLDSEAQRFYIKSTDASGMPQPLRIFDYTERGGASEPPPTAGEPAHEYVERAELAELSERVRKLESRRKPKMEVVEVSEDA